MVFFLLFPYTLMTRGISISELEVTNWELLRLFLLAGDTFTEMRGRR